MNTKKSMAKNDRERPDMRLAEFFGNERYVSFLTLSEKSEILGSYTDCKR